MKREREGGRQTKERKREREIEREGEREEEMTPLPVTCVLDGK